MPTAMRSTGEPSGALIVRDVDRGKPGVDAVRHPAERCMRAVERLEAAGGEARRGENDGKPDQPARAAGGAQATTLTIRLRHDDHLLRRLAVERPFYRIERQNGSLDLGIRRRRGATVTSARFLPLICTGSVSVSSTSRSRSTVRPGRFRDQRRRGRARPSIPRRGAASSGGTVARECQPLRASAQRKSAAVPASPPIDSPIAARSALANS